MKFKNAGKINNRGIYFRPNKNRSKEKENGRKLFLSLAAGKLWPALLFSGGQKQRQKSKRKRSPPKIK